MATCIWDAVWERARVGKNTIIIGIETAPSAPGDLTMLRVRCSTTWTTGGPLDDALQRVKAFVGDDLSRSVQAHEQLVAGLRSGLLDERPVHAIDAVLVEACNRLADWSAGRAVLCFEAVDVADVATIETLVQILQRPGWLRLPLILAMRRVPQGLLAEFMDVLRHQEDHDAILDLSERLAPAEESPGFDWASLPIDVLRVLRAGAVVGSEFEADLIAGLLHEPVGSVLETLQRAADAGAALADRGSGRFYLPPAAVEALQSTLLPSLKAFWHAQLGQLLGGAEPQEITPAALPAQTSRFSQAASAEPGTQPSARWREREPGPPTVGASEGVSPAVYGTMFEPLPVSEGADEVFYMPKAAAVQASSSPPHGPAARPSGIEQRISGQPLPQIDRARAASHLKAAGESEEAVEKFLQAVREVAAHGDARRAYILAQQALKLLDELPVSERRALLRVRLLLELGYAQWRSAAMGAPFTLQDAMVSLEAAHTALPATAPPDITGQLAAVTAGVCYDLGDLASLQRALHDLTVASRCLMQAGESLLATQLLNDQAALYVRMGDPVRATHLLSQSRELFQNLVQTTPDHAVANEELAATEHLLARLPLHAQIRPGREEDAYRISLDHARSAERIYQQLGQQQEIGRVWETMGRLEMNRGQVEKAQECLTTALTLQKQLGDVIGLARSTAALADLCVMADHLEQAAVLLADSVSLNFEKGSHIGLAFNRRAFAALQEAVSRSPGARTHRLQETLQEVASRLEQAESVLGRFILPETASEGR